MRGVDRKAGGAPVLRHGVEHTIDGARVRKARIEGTGVIVRQLRDVERFDQVLGYIGGDRVIRRHEYVPATTAGLQLGQHLLVRPEDVDLHEGAGLIGEHFEVRRVVVVRPSRQNDAVADIARCLRGPRAQPRHRRGEHRRGGAQSCHTKEMPAADRPLLVAAELFQEFPLRYEVVVFHFPISLFLGLKFISPA